jgi:hypothetical protein
MKFVTAALRALAVAVETHLLVIATSTAAATALIAAAAAAGLEAGASLHHARTVILPTGVIANLTGVAVLAPVVAVAEVHHLDDGATTKMVDTAAPQEGLLLLDMCQDPLKLALLLLLIAKTREVAIDEI